jgi:hypothetical protein
MTRLAGTQFSSFNFVWLAVVVAAFIFVVFK